MFDFQSNDIALPEMGRAQDLFLDHKRTGLTGAKKAFDIIGALLLLPLLAVVTLIILVLNPFFNRGPLLFVQDRMGFRCKPFAAIKFRTMTVATVHTRGAYDHLEQDRITRLGRFLRKSRLDELPQIINVLRGQMSLIGPRPDHYDHACVYLREVPGYRARHQVVPGISGFAQIKVGYVDGMEGVHRKVAADLHYISHATFAFDLWITWRTLVVVIARRGS